MEVLGCFLRGKARPTTTAPLCIGVIEGKPTADQVPGEFQDRTREKCRRFRIANDLQTVEFGLKVPLSRFRLQHQDVLESRATASLHSDPKELVWRSLSLANPSHLRKGCLCDRNRKFSAVRCFQRGATGSIEAFRGADWRRRVGADSSEFAIMSFKVT